MFCRPPFCFPGEEFSHSRAPPIFSALGARFFRDPPLFFRAPRRPFPARDARAADAPGGYASGAVGRFSADPSRFLPISGAFSAIVWGFSRISAHFPWDSPRRAENPGPFPGCGVRVAGGLDGRGKEKSRGDPGIMAPPHSSDASRAASIFAAFAAAAALWASLAGALHDTSFAGHSK